MQVSLVQVCGERHGSRHIWLLHIARIKHRVPKGLADLLMDKDILKAGRNVGGDLRRLCRLNGLQGFEGAFELGSCARARGLIDDGCATVLGLWRLNGHLHWSHPLSYCANILERGECCMPVSTVP